MHMIIKNISELIPPHLSSVASELRRTALNALEIAIEEVKPYNLMKNKISLKNSTLVINGLKINLLKHKNIYVIGGGKACYHMASFLVEIFEKAGFHSYEGVINIPKGLDIGPNQKIGEIIINLASHPIPDEDGLNGTIRMMDLVRKAKPNELILCLISGGGSALLPLPKKSVSLLDLKQVNELLLSSGVSIHEINTIRKHLSDFKGGNLAKINYIHGNSNLISLIISDVIGDDLDSIASGPTVADTTTYEDVLSIVKRYELENNLPYSVKKIILEGIKGKIRENPKSDDPCFLNVSNFLIGSVKSAIDRVEDFLAKKNYTVLHYPMSMAGEAKSFGTSFANFFIKEKEKSRQDKATNLLAIIGSGELTVTILGNGIGGRNQEMLLSFLNKIARMNLDFSFSVIAANLDGIEGNSKAMGALIDNDIQDKIRKYNINLNNYLANNDSNSFFKAEKLEIITGPTGVNVNDLLIALFQL